MAKTSTATVKAYTKVKKSRPGVHSKTKNSRMKGAKHYKKAYRAQGRKKKKGEPFTAPPGLIIFFTTITFLFF